MDDLKTTMLNTVHVEQGALVRESPMFGVVRVPLVRLNRILTGVAVQESEYQLTLAPEPK